MRSSQDEEEWEPLARTVSASRFPEEGAAHRLSRSGLKAPGSSDSIRYVYPSHLSADEARYSDFVPFPYSSRFSENASAPMRLPKESLPTQTNQERFHKRSRQLRHVPICARNSRECSVEHRTMFGRKRRCVRRWTFEVHGGSIDNCVGLDEPAWCQRKRCSTGRSEDGQKVSTSRCWNRGTTTFGPTDTTGSEPDLRLSVQRGCRKRIGFGESTSLRVGSNKGHSERFHDSTSFERGWSQICSGLLGAYRSFSHRFIAPNGRCQRKGFPI